MKDTEIVAIIPAPPGVTLRMGKNGAHREPVFAFGRLGNGNVVPLVERYADDDPDMERPMLAPPKGETYGFVATWGPRCICDDLDSVSASDPTYCQSCYALLPGAQ